MIYLIGGPSRSGKTTVAKKLQYKTGAYLIPLDYIEAAVSEYYPKESLDVLRPFSAMRREVDRDNAKLVELFAPRQIIEAYEKQGQSTWAGIQAMITYELQRNDSIIVEGYQITPAFVASILKEHGKTMIRSVFLVKEDREAILEGWKHAPANDWLTQNSNKETLKKYSNLTALYGQYVQAESKKYDLMCVNTDLEFHQKIDNALAVLIDTNS